MNKPLLTICILCHNSEKFLEKTLNSIIRQTYPNFEIIISDNYSEDRTPKIAEAFQKENPGQKIIYRRNEKPIVPDEYYIGCYENYNSCLKSGLINGEFVAFCHDDDIYSKTALEDQVNFLIKNPVAGVVFSMVNIINQKNKIIGSTKIPKILSKKNIHNFTEIFEALLYNGNTFLKTPTLVARKNTFDNIGLFNEDKFRTSADLEMWLRIAEKYPIGILNKKLVDYRVGGGGGRLYNKLRIDKADFFDVIEYFMKKESMARKIDKRFLRQYDCQKYFDETLVAMNFLIKEDQKSAKELINKRLPLSVLMAIFENITLLRIKVFSLRIIMLLCVNLGMGKHLGRLLSRV